VKAESNKTTREWKNFFQSIKYVGWVRTCNVWMRRRRSVVEGCSGWMMKQWMEDVVGKSDDFSEQFVVDSVTQFLKRRHIRWAISDIRSQS